MWALENAEKWYVDRPLGELKTYLIHGPGHSSDECKVLVDFGDKYTKGHPTMDHRNHPVTKEKNNKQQKKKRYC